MTKLKTEDLSEGVTLVRHVCGNTAIAVKVNKGRRGLCFVLEPGPGEVVLDILLIGLEDKSRFTRPQAAILGARLTRFAETGSLE